MVVVLYILLCELNCVYLFIEGDIVFVYILWVVVIVGFIFFFVGMLCGDWSFGKFGVYVWENGFWCSEFFFWYVEWRGGGCVDVSYVCIYIICNCRLFVCVWLIFLYGKIWFYFYVCFFI